MWSYWTVFCGCHAFINLLILLPPILSSWYSVWNALMQKCLKGEESKVRKCLVKDPRNNENWTYYIVWVNYDTVFTTWTELHWKYKLQGREGAGKITFRPQHPRNWAGELLNFLTTVLKNWTVHIDIVVAIFAFRLHGLIKGRNYSRDIFNLAVPNSKVLNSRVFMGLQWNNNNKSEQKLICLYRFLLFTFIC